MKNEEIMDLLGEPAHIAEERATINKTLETLKKAQKVLKRDPDLASLPKMTMDDNKNRNETRTDTSLFGKLA